MTLRMMRMMIGKNGLIMAKENFIDKLHEAGMLYFVLGSLISAETLVDVESCQKSMKILETQKRDFEASKMKGNEKIKKFLEDAERIIKRDLKRFEEAGS